MKNIYESLFGDSPATQQARESRNTAFQDMLNSRKQAVEQRRTDDVKMAQYNALGNLLTSLVQPVGWAVGGRGNTMNTGGVQQYDDRQYLQAFNRAVKASDDLRNIGTAEDEYRFKLADEDYKRQLTNDQQMRNAVLAEQQDIRRAQIKSAYEEQRQADELEKIAARGDVQKWLAEYRAAHRVTGRGGLSVDDRALVAARNNYEQYKRNRLTAGQPYLSFEQYMQNEEGYSVQDTTAKPAAKPATAKPATAAKPATTTAKTSGSTGKVGGFNTGASKSASTSSKVGGFKH